MTAAPLVDGAVVIDGDAILDVLPQAQLPEKYSQTTIDSAFDYGQSIIVPGFINMHSHLDYSALHGFDDSTNMFDWIGALVGRSSKWSRQQWYESALSGAEQSALSGISCVVDSSFTGFSVKALAATGLRGFVGLELFGIKEEEADAVWEQWLERYEKLRSDPQVSDAFDNQRIKLTVSPHAPYTVCPSLWMKAQNWGRHNRLPILAHLAESLEECLWIREGSRTIDEYLTFVRQLKNPQLATTADGIAQDVKDIQWHKKGLSPVQHLDCYELLNADLIAAHCIHLSDDDLNLLAQKKVKVAHCPRSNVRLGNGRAPMESFIQHKIAFAFGTDSLASCDDLDLLNECRFAADFHKVDGATLSLTADELLRRITIESAQMLHVSDRIGSLEPGKQADIGVFASEGKDSQQNTPADRLIFSQRRLLDLYVAGTRVVANGALTSPAPQCA
jgi:cytosine/adenosine deaminase-related metal-dependent hydrolase